MRLGICVLNGVCIDAFISSGFDMGADSSCDFFDARVNISIVGFKVINNDLVIEIIVINGSCI